MKSKVYCLYDSKVEVFQRPFMCRNDGEATRGFSELVNGKDNVVASNPGDFGLFRIAEYDDNTGTYENEKIPVNLGLGLAYKKGDSSVEISEVSN